MDLERQQQLESILKDLHKASLCIPHLDSSHLKARERFHHLLLVGNCCNLRWVPLFGYAYKI